MDKALHIAAFQLGLLYRAASFPVQEALRHSGIDIRHASPRVVMSQPYDMANPNALEYMLHDVKAYNRLEVSGLFSAATVYDSPSDNHAFRFLHDMGHLLYGLGFDYAGESALHPRLWSWIETVPMFWSLSKEEQRWCWAVYMADTRGQTDYYETHNVFPENQRAFVLDKAREYYHASPY